MYVEIMAAGTGCHQTESATDMYAYLSLQSYRTGGTRMEIDATAAEAHTKTICIMVCTMSGQSAGYRMKALTNRQVFKQLRVQGCDLQQYR